MKVLQIYGPLSSQRTISLSNEINTEAYIRQIGIEHIYSIPFPALWINNNLEDLEKKEDIFLRINVNGVEYQVPDRGFLEFENLNAKARNVTIIPEKDLSFYDRITIAYE